MMNIDKKLIKLRNEYVSCIKLAKETDSKKEDAHLKEEAKIALEQLKKCCTHNYTVVQQSEYSGSYSYDYDDHSPEDRICLICGTEEYAYENKFKILTTVPFSRFEGKFADQIKNPLSYLLSDTIEVAEKGYEYFGRYNGR